MNLHDHDGETIFFFTWNLTLTIQHKIKLTVLKTPNSSVELALTNEDELRRVSLLK